jgi:hypothetical protein
MLNKLATLLILTGTAGIALGAPAQDQVTLVTTQREGVIDHTDFAQNRIVINDAEYAIPRFVEVQEERREVRARRIDLKAGMPVRFAVTGEGGGQQGRIMQVWILEAPPAPSLE